MTRRALAMLMVCIVAVFAAYAWGAASARAAMLSTESVRMGAWLREAEAAVSAIEALRPSDPAIIALRAKLADLRSATP